MKLELKEDNELVVPLGVVDDPSPFEYSVSALTNSIICSSFGSFVNSVTDSEMKHQSKDLKNRFMSITFLACFRDLIYQNNILRMSQERFS